MCSTSHSERYGSEEKDRPGHSRTGGSPVRPGALPPACDNTHSTAISELGWVGGSDPGWLQPGHPQVPLQVLGPTWEDDPNLGRWPLGQAVAGVGPSSSGTRAGQGAMAGPKGRVPASHSHPPPFHPMPHHAVSHSACRAVSRIYRCPTGNREFWVTKRGKNFSTGFY